jgi:molecular chaperone GrpE (heat shock protein)
MIIGLVLLLAGGLALWWDLTEIQRVREEIARYQSKYSTETDDYMKQYNEWLLLPADERATFPLLLDKDGKTKTRAQLKQEQHERLTADLDKLASGKTEIHPLADALYGENWLTELQAYKKQKQLNKSVLMGSIVCTSMGGLIYVWWLLFGTVRMVAKGLAGLKQRIATSTAKPMERDDEEDVPPEQESPPQHDQSQQQPRIVLKSNWGNWKPAESDPEVNAEVNEIKKISDEAERIASLLSDEKAIQREALKAKPLDDSDFSKPIDDTLNQLSQEVSAIREYTTYQQDRLEKLQDGYDWNIIRTFCLRVIRCIDNLDNRISQLSGKSSKANHLEEVRDELIFALESSGVEQFEPEINSEYRGQEKFAEAVKDRQSCEEPEQKGKIAGVIRPGYQYFISEENIKVVRPAQVRLFG